ncbi:hypothetical protein Ahy_B04g072865 [Arachis hypogaea]|uniref:Uncharacterized protein n=1 Tax=Arachis hypogaea TaxID=3818 RepID=A0A444ZP74_ARAHY|nr:hypothetical protein Ahy_B04g072865 [Arachis hypogaea]
MGVSLLHLHFIWDTVHDLTIRKIFDHRIGRWLQQMLEDVHERRDHLTTWLRPKIKKALLVHCETDEGFIHRRLTDRANKALARLIKYTSSSVAFMKTKAKRSKLSDCDATLVETFKYTHKLKENKARFADQRSQYHYRLEDVTQQSQQSKEDTVDGSIASVVDFDAVWRKTVSAPYKNHIYGLGSFFASSLHTSTLRPSSRSATSQDVKPEEGMDLRLQLQEFQSSHHQ